MSGARWPLVISARKITPIVFWASWRPWPSAIADADTVCASRKPRVTLPAFRLRKIHRIASITTNASAKPTSGEITIGITTLSTMVDQCTVVPAASAAPTSPPIRAWDDDDGRPKYQVVRFQMIAPSSPARTTTSPSRPSGGTITSETVWATFWPRNAPTKFITAARISATRGVRARVDTDVAMAFAASWNPLV